MIERNLPSIASLSKNAHNRQDWLRLKDIQSRSPTCVARTQLLESQPVGISMKLELEAEAGN